MKGPRKGKTVLMKKGTDEIIALSDTSLILKLKK